MKRSLLLSALAAGSLVLVGSSIATAFAGSIVPFTGTVINSCILTVGTPGVMAPSSDYTVLGSKQAGGTSGVVTAVSTGTTFQVSVDAPSSFTLAPTGGNTSVSFATRYSGVGATNIGSTPGTTATALSSGVTVLTVDLAATKSTGVFTQGSYTAEAVVRCE